MLRVAYPSRWGKEHTGGGARERPCPRCTEQLPSTPAALGEQEQTWERAPRALFCWDKMVIKIAGTEGLIVIYTRCCLCVSFVIHHCGFIWTDTLAVDLAQTKISRKMCYGAKAALARINGKGIFSFLPAEPLQCSFRIPVSVFHWSVTVLLCWSVTLMVFIPGNCHLSSY